MDNVITVVNICEEAKALYTESKSLFAAASMNLHEWFSNSQEFMTVLPQEDKVSNISNIHKIRTWN